MRDTDKGSNQDCQCRWQNWTNLGTQVIPIYIKVFIYRFKVQCSRWFCSLSKNVCIKTTCRCWCSIKDNLTNFSFHLLVLHTSTIVKMFIVYNIEMLALLVCEIWLLKIWNVCYCKILMCSECRVQSGGFMCCFLLGILIHYHESWFKTLS